MQAAPTGNMTKTERLNRVSRILKEPLHKLAKRFGKDGKMSEEALQAAERRAGVEYRVEPMAYDAHFGGTGVSLQRDGGEIPLTSSQLRYAVQAWRRKLKQQADAKKREEQHRLTGEYAESDRPPQMVHSCDTAGPGLTYCDPMIPNQCPDAADLVGTPYENIWSTIGVPPNNKVVQCVPKELVRITTDDKKREEDMDLRMTKVMKTLSSNAKAMADLAMWRDKAPCDSIPEIAFSENNNMCGTLYGKKDRLSQRCMDHKIAAKLLPDGDPKKTQAQESVDGNEARTCYDNPKELLRSLKKLVTRVQLWRQKLRRAVESAMRVPNFVQQFNHLGKQLQSKYQDHLGQPLQWSTINNYMSRDDITTVDDVVETSKKCKDVEREMRQIEALLQGGGGDDCEDDDCNMRFIRLLKIVSRMIKEEKQLRDEFAAWVSTDAERIAALEKDAQCMNHKANPDYCQTMKEACGVEVQLDPETAEQDCLKTPGGGYVHADNQDKTWTVEGFTSDGIMEGFKRVENPEVMDMYGEYERYALQQCATNRNMTQSKVDALKASHAKQAKEIATVIARHYPEAMRQMDGKKYKEAIERTNDTADLQTSLQAQIEIAVKRALATVKPPELDVEAERNKQLQDDEANIMNIFSVHERELAQEFPSVYIDVIPTPGSQKVHRAQRQAQSTVTKLFNDKSTAQNIEQSKEALQLLDSPLNYGEGGGGGEDEDKDM